MAHSAVPASAPVAVAPISLSALAPWAVFAAVVTLFLLYLVGVEQGAAAVFQGENVHEWMHDGRHLLGFPCH
ncbi:CbtB-domain containing protein [Streptomyces racemochromogenes]|uniref:CbtB-domain containing protein n=1 Tax=Streptomyces racemochromogenes TaxID=67353 RepID=A0ABW7PGT1_9ACTN